MRSTARPPSYKALAADRNRRHGADGRVLAASDPNRIPAYSELPPNYLDRYGTERRDDRRRPS